MEISANQVPPTSNRIWLIVGVTAVLFAYSLPFLLNHFRHGPPLIVAVGDEKIYLARVMDAYRGGSLGNPYLAEHQDAPRYMPEAAERLMAFTAHVAGLDPLTLLAASRIVLPALICILLWSLARGLGLEPRLAMLAAILPQLAPGISWMGALNTRSTGFLRYFRAISPGFYVVLLLLALRLILLAWKKPNWRTGLLAGVAIGLLFYLAPVYYWSFALGGVAWLAVQESGRVRTAMLTSLGTTLVLGLPSLLRSRLQARAPDVRQTLERLDLLLPGRAPDDFVARTLVLAVIVIAAVWLWRSRLGESGRFLLPFLCVGALLMVQNVVTNRHLQGYHWIECLMPVWALATAAVLQSFAPSLRPIYFLLLLAVVIAGAVLTQTMAFMQWEDARKEGAEFWALDARMPHTLAWLNEHTSCDSVVLASPDVMDSLVLFTHNKVYWADYASQHVMPEWEVQARAQSMESWRPDSQVRLPFRADFYLGTGNACLNLDANDLLYRNPGEDTCVVPISRQP